MIKAIVTDIEGTTSSLSFVKDILFPYARTHLADFVRHHQDSESIKSLLQDACQEVGEELDTEQLIALFKQWMAEDRKATPLKSLQGLIWEAGYELGAFTGHLYQDAVESLQAWKSQGLDLYVYSSGSVYAQKLLFSHSDYGDLTPLFSGYFDTHIGGKKEAESYQRIAEQIQRQPGELLFLSDLKEELDAARLTGYQTIWLTRDNLPNPDAEHRQVSRFDLIRL
ncbi:MAG: acireductone synthase [Methylococcaceae bacterium]|nr:acireductone synthase [Methylococcaceae bacterium]